MDTSLGRGYEFFPPCSLDEPGHLQLTVWLREAPTLRHYDPEHVTCPALNERAEVGALRVEHPWPRAQEYRVIPGRIVVNDRKGKKVQAYSFGGVLEVTPEKTVTVCVFRSPAPILPLTGGDHAAELFAAEVMARLAARQGAWDTARRAGDFLEHLAEADPLQLYCACLEEITDHLRTTHPGMDELERRLLHFIHHGRETLEAAGRWPAQPPRLEELA